MSAVVDAEGRLGILLLNDVVTQLGVASSTVIVSTMASIYEYRRPKQETYGARLELTGAYAWPLERLQVFDEVALLSLGQSQF